VAVWLQCQGPECAGLSLRTDNCNNKDDDDDDNISLQLQCMGDSDVVLPAIVTAAMLEVHYVAAV